MGYVFISYSSKDSAKADRLRMLLKDRGFETWMAPGDIPAGKKYAQCIVSAIRDCSCFLLLLTDNAQNSTWVPKEVERAVSFKRPIVPLMLEDLVLNDEFSLYISTEQAVRAKGLFLNDEGMLHALASVEACVGAAEPAPEAAPPEKPAPRRVSHIRPIEFDVDDDVLFDDEFEEDPQLTRALNRGGTNFMRVLNFFLCVSAYPMLTIVIRGYCVDKGFGYFLTMLLLFLPGALMSGIIWTEMHLASARSVIRYDCSRVARTWLVTMAIGLLIGLLIGLFTKSSDTVLVRVSMSIITTFINALLSLSPAFESTLYGFLSDDDGFDDPDIE